MKVTISLENCNKINEHIHTLRTIADMKELTIIQQIIMNDTISIFEGIKKELY